MYFMYLILDFPLNTFVNIAISSFLLQCSQISHKLILNISVNSNYFQNDLLIYKNMGLYENIYNIYNFFY